MQQHKKVICIYFLIEACQKTYLFPTLIAWPFSNTTQLVNKNRMHTLHMRLSLPYLPFTHEKILWLDLRLNSHNSLITKVQMVPSWFPYISHTRMSGGETLMTMFSIDLIHILTVRLELAYNGGWCREYQLNMKRLPRITLCCLLVPVQPWEYEYRLLTWPLWSISIGAWRLNCYQNIERPLVWRIWCLTKQLLKIPSSTRHHSWLSLPVKLILVDQVDEEASDPVQMSPWTMP